MDILEHLTNEHRQAEQLMAALDATDPGPERDRLVGELTAALNLHMEVEEEFLYPIVGEVIGSENEEEAEIEHDLARDGIAKLNELRAEPGFKAALAMVKAGIAHHVGEEEGELFPKLRSQAAAQLARLNPDELEVEAAEDESVDVDLTKEELYQMAQDAAIPGRSSMTKDELAEAVSKSK